MQTFQINSPVTYTLTVILASTLIFSCGQEPTSVLQKQDTNKNPLVEVDQTPVNCVFSHGTADSTISPIGSSGFWEYDMTEWTIGNGQFGVDAIQNANLPFRQSPSLTFPVLGKTPYNQTSLKSPLVSMAQLNRTGEVNVAYLVKVYVYVPIDDMDHGTIYINSVDSYGTTLPSKNTIATLTKDFGLVPGWNFVSLEYVPNVSAISLQLAVITAGGLTLGGFDITKIENDTCIPTDFTSSPTWFE